MFNETFQTEKDYLRYVKNLLLFTHLRCYNGQCQIWKDEDYSLICNIENIKLKTENPILWAQSVDVYLRAKKEYADTLDLYRSNFSDLSPDEILYAFGFDNPENDDGHVTDNLDIDLSKLNKNTNYPKSFPVIIVLGDGEKFETDRIYPEDFSKSVKIEDFNWLETNIRKFWNEGKGSFFE
jgi:hypothetical protein